MDSALLRLSLASLRSRSGLAPSALALSGGRSGGAPPIAGERCGKAASPAAVVSVIREPREQRRVGLLGLAATAEVAPLHTLARKTRAVEHALRRDVADTHVRFGAVDPVRERMLDRRTHTTRRNAAAAGV